MGIGSTFARNIARPKNYPEPFWGKYVELNDVSVPSIDAIQNYQLQKIKEFENISLSKMKKHEQLNALFSSGDINSIYGQHQNGENIELDQTITNIINALNGTYWTRTKADGDYQYNYKALQEQLIKVRKAIEPVNNMLSGLKDGEGIDGRFLDTIDVAIAGCEADNLNPAAIAEWFKKINLFKGDLVEEIGTKWLNNLKLPNIMTLNTGAVNYQGSVSNGRHKGQLIQDLMVLEIGGIELDQIPIQYRTTGGENVEVSLKEFFQIIENASGGSKQIIIEDNAYDLLESLSAMNIQAKAGLNQKPWNEGSKNTFIAINELGEDNLSVSAKRTISLLHQLDCENNPEKSIWAKDTSKDYNLIADYGLATKIFKVLHLDGPQGNQYLLTPQGFTPYSVRLRNLMEKRKSRLTFKSAINISPEAGDVMGISRPITMTNYN